MTKDGANTGNVAINNCTEPMSLLSSVCLLKPIPEMLDSSFLFYYLQSSEGFGQITGQMTGAAIKRIILRTIKSSKIPTPPLPEQKRIVAILDEAFAGIERAVANTEKNLANVKELIGGYTDSIFSQREYDWIEKPLSEYSTSISTGPFGSLFHKSDYVSNGVPLVNPINIVGSEIVPDPKKLVNLETRERLKAYLLRNGDLVIARRGEIGRCAVVDGEQNGWVCGTGCFFIRPKPGIIPRFLEIVIKSQKYRAELERQATGATMKNLSNKALSNLRVSMPDEFVQNAIVNQFDELNEQCRNLESVFQQKITGLSELKQSLLHKAFSGELTAGKAENEMQRAAA